MRIDEIKNAVRPACREFGVRRLDAFGSVARGEGTPSSDIDLLVEMAPDHDLFDMIALSRELGVLLHQKTDVVSDEELSPYLRERILLEAVTV